MQLPKICQHGWKERLAVTNITVFQSGLFLVEANDDIAPQTGGIFTEVHTNRDFVEIVEGCIEEILKFDHLCKSYWAVLSSGTVYYAVQGGFKFQVCGRIPKVWPFKWKLLSSTSLWYCLLCRTRWFQLLIVWVQFYRVSLFSSTPVSFYAVEMKSFPKSDIARTLNSLQATPPHLDLFTC